MLYQGREKFPLLEDIKLEGAAFNFELLFRNLKGHNSETVNEALINLLVELLGVIGTLTADILAEPLHKELLELTVQKFQSQKEQDAQVLPQFNLRKKTGKV